MEKHENDPVVDTLHETITERLCALGKVSPYASDADEPDPRYRAYGVRAPQMKQFVSSYKADFRELSVEQKVDLARRLISSGYGEQKTVALALLERVSDYFSPARFDALEQLVRGLHGWSKIDAYTGSFLRLVLESHEAEFIDLLRSWVDDDDLWLRRASVVTFTRKAAKSGRYKNVALANCEALIEDPERLVQTGVGWCLRDLMRWHQDDVLPYVVELRNKGVSSTITLYALRDIKGALREEILKKRS